MKAPWYCVWASSNLLVSYNQNTGFLRKKKSFQTRNYTWLYSSTDQIYQSPGIVWASSSKYSADSTIGLFYCRLLTVLTHIPCFRFQRSRKMREQAGMTLQVSPNSILKKYFDLMNAMYLVMGYISVPSKIHAEIRLSLWQLYKREPLLGVQASGSALMSGSVFSLHRQVHYKIVNLLLAVLLRVPPSLPFLGLSDMWGLHLHMTQQEGPCQKGHLGHILSFCEFGK